MADHNGSFNAERVQQLNGVLGKVIRRIAIRGLVGLAMPALVRHDGSHTRRQERENAAVGEPGVGISMQHRDGLTVPRAQPGNVQAKVGGQAMRREPQIIRHGLTLLREK
jgi:hypothetical protein